MDLNQPRPGWAPDPPMVGIRSPIGLVVGSCTSHPGVLGSIPKREEPGKTGAPCVKVPGSSRVPDIATSPVIVLYSRALCARLCVYTNEAGFQGSAARDRSKSTEPDVRTGPAASSAVRFRTAHCGACKKWGHWHTARSKSCALYKKRN